jgi:hypothetical protein
MIAQSNMPLSVAMASLIKMASGNHVFCIGIMVHVLKLAVLINDDIPVLAILTSYAVYAI